MAKKSSPGSASAAYANCAADRFGMRTVSGPSGRVSVGRPYSQPESTTANPPTTAVQRIALAMPRRAVARSRPATTARAWSIPNPTTSAASCE